MAALDDIDLAEVFDVGTWPRKWRRVFVLTLPISGPLYVLVFAATIVFLALAITVLGVACGFAYMWTGKPIR